MTDRSDPTDSSSSIADFSGTGMRTVRPALQERYGREMQLQLGNAEDYDSRAECRVTLLQIEADHHRNGQLAGEAER